VSPGAARAAVVGRHGEAWKVRVTPPPQAGLANAAVEALLAAALGLPRGAVAVVSGRGARDKVVRRNGIGRAEAERRLTQAAGAA